MLRASDLGRLCTTIWYTDKRAQVIPIVMEEEGDGALEQAAEIDHAETGEYAYLDGAVYTDREAFMADYWSRYGGDIERNLGLSSLGPLTDDEIDDRRARIDSALEFEAECRFKPAVLLYIRHKEVDPEW